MWEEIIQGNEEENSKLNENKRHRETNKRQQKVMRNRKGMLCNYKILY